MTTPVWQSGTFYTPGALVIPATAPPIVQDAPTNADFELGASGWTLDSDFTIGEFGVAYVGSWSVRFTLQTAAAIRNTNNVPVTPGQSITATCNVQQRAHQTNSAGGYVRLYWLDSLSAVIGWNDGNAVTGSAHNNWGFSQVSAVAPAGAVYAAIGGVAYRTLNNATQIYLDNFQWNYTYAEAPEGMIYKAVQADAGFSGSTEPAWPVVAGNTVVDNEVTWEAIIATRVVWEATPIMVSGSTEPTWPTAIGANILDGTVNWRATSRQVTDAKCPHSRSAIIAASKIFAPDGDIIRFCATNNCLDWSSANDAGYIPYGLQTYGANPVAALGLYRGNLMAFNSEGFQMWQVDQDPTNMALLDAVPVGSESERGLQPVGNDLIIPTAVGVRNVSIAGASTNLQADGVGEPVDALVQVAIDAATYEEIGLFWPAAGQYWLFFGPEAFVLTINGAKKKSWSRYVYPEAITDWTLHGSDLYLRTETHKVWKVDKTQVQDDVHTTAVGGAVAYVPGSKDAFSPTAATTINLTLVNSDVDVVTYPDAVVVLSLTAVMNSAPGTTVDPTDITIGGVTADIIGQRSLINYLGSDKDTYAVVAMVRVPEGGFSTDAVVIEWPSLVTASAGVRASLNAFYNVDPSSDAFALGYDTANAVLTVGPLSVPAGGAVYVTNMQYTAGDWDAEMQSADDSVAYTMQTPDVSHGFATYYMTGYRLFAGAATENLESGPDQLAVPLTPAIAFVMAPTSTVGPPEGTDFSGVIHWPFLDMGQPGQDKGLEGLDIVATAPEGLLVSVGANQRDRTDRTTPYEVDDDTMTGFLIPFPLSGPSFDLKLEFNPAQAWEWFAANLYTND